MVLPDMAETVRNVDSTSIKIIVTAKIIIYKLFVSGDSLFTAVIKYFI